MKAFLIFLMLMAIGLLWYDDNAKRTDLTQANARAEAAEQQAQADAAQLQQLTAQRNQLQMEVNRVTNVAPAAQPPGAPAPSTPEWFQQRLNGAPTVLDAPAAPGH